MHPIHCWDPLYYPFPLESYLLHWSIIYWHSAMLCCRATLSITSRWHMAEKVILHMVLPMILHYRMGARWYTVRRSRRSCSWLEYSGLTKMWEIVTFSTKKSKQPPTSTMPLPLYFLSFCVTASELILFSLIWRVTLTVFLYFSNWAKICLSHLMFSPVALAVHKKSLRLWHPSPAKGHCDWGI